MATDGNDTLRANRYGQTATWDGADGVDTLSFDGRTQNSFTYTEIDGAIHVDSASGASHEYHFTLFNVEKVVIGRNVIDLGLMFPSDTDAPLVARFSPSDNSDNVPISADIIIEFNEEIIRGTGNIIITDASGGVVENYSVSDSPNLSISGSSLTINPTADFALNTRYTIELSNGSIKDAAGNSYTGINTYSFTTTATNIISGSEGNDIIHGSIGNDTIDGSAGIDTINFSGSSSSYNISKSGSNYAVTGIEGNDTLSNVERLHFNDISLALDIDGHAGMVVKLLGVVFGSDAAQNSQFVGIGLDLLDGGMNYEVLMELAISLTGANTNEAIVDLLWENLLGSLPNTEEAAPIVSLLADGIYTPTSLGVAAAELEVNANNIDLVGLIESGIEYIPII
ncbi:MAG: hypothetical protein GQ475_03065 [Methylococcaceae bacterium]|nr:hypothetical protein [Methylococcaceae bacterium]